MMGFYFINGFICFIAIAGVIFFHYQDKKAERKQKEN